MKFVDITFALTTLTVAAQPPPERGELLFYGRVPLTAKLAGSEDNLSPAATRCSNCHGSDARGTAEGDVKGSDIRGPALTLRQSRRGGPPSSYNLETFRLALRAGHDPAHVVLARAMPRYTISAADSAAIWTYLLSLGSQ